MGQENTTCYLSGPAEQRNFADHEFPAISIFRFGPSWEFNPLRDKLKATLSYESVDAREICRKNVVTLTQFQIDHI